MTTFALTPSSTRRVAASEIRAPDGLAAHAVAQAATSRGDIDG